MRQLLAVALLCAPLLANGTLEVRGDRAGTVALTRHSVAAAIRDQLAEVTVEQVFLSRGTRRAEGVYVFPLPAGASVSDFEMTVDGKTMRGEVLERGKARRIYEDIVREKRDPALLEQVDRETFRARVFPIDPGKEIAIRVTYQQILDDHDGNLELRYPLARQRLGAGDLARVDLRVEIESSIDLLGVASPSHALAAGSEGKRHATLTLSGGAELQSNDLLVHIRRDPAAIGFTLLGHRDAGDPGTFLAILSPPTRLPDEAIPARDLVYVVDTSGSMEGDKIAQAKAALKRGVALLRPRDRFRIIAFSTEVRPFRSDWTAASESARRDALAWIDRLEAGGGTAIDEALAEALRAGDSARLSLMVFLTDGLPTIGERDGKRIVANARERNGASMRIFCFGVGFDQDVPFLDDLALSTRASREYVTQGQDLGATLVRFFDRVQQPALTDLRIEWGGGATEVYPHPLPDLFAGDRLVVAGRYDEAGPRLVKLRGTRLGQPVEFVYEGSLPERGGVAAVPRLWAQRKIEFLLSEIRRNGETAELRNEVVALATRHRIVTPYTAGLVVEDTPLSPQETISGGPGAGADTDSVFEEVESEDGMSDGPFVGPSTNSVIGLGGGRRGGGGKRHAKAGGGSGMTEDALESGLKWIADHQDVDGAWDHDVGASGLALLSFLGAGYTDRGSESENRYAKNVRAGLRSLVAGQDAEGCFSATRSIREHALATLAVCEAYWMTRNPRYRAPAQAALDFLARSRTRDGGWEDDAMTTIWALCAVKSGKYAGLETDPDAFEGGRGFLHAREASLTPTEQAGWLFVRILIGEDPRTSPSMEALADAVLAHAPAWRDDAAPPVDLWYFGTLAMFQTGGMHWKRWNETLVTGIVRHQRPKDAGDLAGTWPVGAGAPSVVEQAKLAMCLEVYYRYDRVFGLK